MAAKGLDCIVWFETTDSFPFFKGVVAIIVSWILSPIPCGLASAGFFYLLRKFVLTSQDSFNRVFWISPVCLSLTLIIYIFFIIYKGAKGLGSNDASLSVAVIWALGAGIGIHLLIWPFYRWLGLLQIKNLKNMSLSLKHFKPFTLEEILKIKKWKRYKLMRKT